MIFNIKNNQMIKNGIWSVLGTFFIKGINLISIPIFSRLMSTEDFGNFNLFITYAAVLTILETMDLAGCIGRGVIEYSDDKEKFISSVLTLSFFSFSIFSIISIILQGIICYLLDITPMILYLLLLYGFADYTLTLFSTYMIFNYKYKENALICGGIAILSLLLSALLIQTVFIYDKFLGRVLGASVPMICICVLIVVSFLHLGRTYYNKGYWIFSTRMSIPLIPHNLSHLVFSQSDRIMISKFFGLTQTGIYSLIFNIPMMLQVLVTAMNNAWTPWLFRKLEKNEIKDIIPYSMKYITLFSVITILLMALGPEIVKILGPEAYWDGIGLTFPLILASYFYFLYTFYCNLEIYKKNTKIMSLCTVLAAIVNIVINLVFMPIFGYKIATVSTLIAYILLFVIHKFVVEKVFCMKLYSSKFIYINIFLVSFATIILYIFIGSLLSRVIISLLYMIIYILLLKWSDNNARF